MATSNLTYAQFISGASEAIKTECVNCSSIAKQVQKYLTMAAWAGNKGLKKLYSEAWKEYKNEDVVVYDFEKTSNSDSVAWNGTLQLMQECRSERYYISYHSGNGSDRGIKKYINSTTADQITGWSIEEVMNLIY